MVNRLITWLNINWQLFASRIGVEIVDMADPVDRVPRSSIRLTQGLGKRNGVNAQNKDATFHPEKFNDSDK